MKSATHYLLKKGLDDLVLNDRSKTQYFDYVYASDIMEEYASYRIEQLLDVDLEEVEHTSVINFTKGAKWLLKTLKNKANFIK